MLKDWFQTPQQHIQTDRRDYYNRKRRIHLKALKRKCFRAEENGLLPKEEDDLISQFSTFFGTHIKKNLTENIMSIYTWWA